MQDPRLVISCEHASNAIPSEFQHLFHGHEAKLDDHWGWDFGAAEQALALAKRFDVTPHMGEFSRLLVDLNRSPHNHRRFSPHTRSLPAAVRRDIDRRFHSPYQSAVREAIASRADAGGAVHISVHSFTPELNGEVRQCELGLLYDPKRADEREFARQLQARLAEHLPDWRVRCNYPYTGVQDGIIPFLRRHHGPEHYFGLELELNFNVFDQPPGWSDILHDCLAGQLQERFGLRRKHKA